MINAIHSFVHPNSVYYNRLRCPYLKMSRNFSVPQIKSIVPQIRSFLPQNFVNVKSNDPIYILINFFNNLQLKYSDSCDLSA